MPCPDAEMTGVSRLTCGRNRRASATLLPPHRHPGHDGEPPPRPASLPGGPRAEGIPHDREALPVACRSPGAAKPVAGAPAGTACGPRSRGWRSASRPELGILPGGHSGVLAGPAGDGVASLAARRVIGPPGQAGAHALSGWPRCRRRPGYRRPEGAAGPGPSSPCGGGSGPIVGMNRASRGSGAWQRPRQSPGWRPGGRGSPVRKPVDYLCKGTVNLCATWG